MITEFVGWSELPFLFGVITASYVRNVCTELHHMDQILLWLHHEPLFALLTSSWPFFFPLVWAKELIANSFLFNGISVLG